MSGPAPTGTRRIDGSRRPRPRSRPEVPASRFHLRQPRLSPQGNSQLPRRSCVRYGSGINTEVSAMRTLLLLMALALAAGAARADNGLIYVGAGVSKDKLSNIAPSGGLADIDKTSWKVLAGLRPVSVFAVEADYLDLGSQTSAFVGGTSHSDAKAFAAYAVWFLPIPVPYLDLYGKAGLARWKLNGSSPLVSAPFSTNGTEFAWGSGAPCLWRERDRYLIKLMICKGIF